MHSLVVGLILEGNLVGAYCPEASYFDTCVKGSGTDWFYNEFIYTTYVTGLIIMSGTCCGQEAQSVNYTSGGRSGTQSY